MSKYNTPQAKARRRELYHMDKMGIKRPRVPKYVIRDDAHIYDNEETREYREASIRGLREVEANRHRDAGEKMGRKVA